MSKLNLKRAALRSFLLYVLDMAAAICGWVYGFGLEVKNWWVLIIMLLVVRWVFYVVQGAYLYEAAKQRVSEEARHEQ